jgi:hypothetical protein
MRGYKYIPYSSIWDLLLICSAEKRLSYARKCKKVQEPSEEIVIWESKIKDLISA